MKPVTHSDARIAFRSLTGPDLPGVQRWLADPDVATWWREPDLSLDALVGKYQPIIDGTEPVQGYVIVIDGQPVGFIQAYRLGDHPEYQRQLEIEPEAVATDLFIGEAAWRNRGWGAVVLGAFLQRVVFGEMRAGVAMIAPEPATARAIRVYERVGFRWEKTVSVVDEEDPARTNQEYVMFLRRGDFSILAG